MHILHDILNLFLPRTCPVCGRRLHADEALLCSYCSLIYDLGGVYDDYRDNPMTRSLFGQVMVERANAMFRFLPHGSLAQSVYDLKYHLRPDIGVSLGRRAVAEMGPKGFFDGIDAIVPVPLTPARQRWRGYNQAEMFARGISQLTGITVMNRVVRRAFFNKSQTQLNHNERLKNVENAFQLVNDAPIRGKHVLIVDDIFTTGATAIACAKTLAGDFLKIDNLGECTSVSVLAIGLAGDLPLVTDYHDEEGLDNFNSNCPCFSAGMNIFADRNSYKVNDMETTATIFAEKLLDIEAIKLQPHEPFTWASGWKAPIYCDNRKTLAYPDIRRYVKIALTWNIQTLFPEAEAVAGVATGAIAQGALVADMLNMPFVYVRSKPKDHGMGNLIEGQLPQGAKVVVVEDLISTGGSSLKAVEALRDAGYDVVGMVAAFSYGFHVAEEAFRQADVKLVTLTDYQHVVDVAASIGYVTPDVVDILRQWRNNPDTWGK